MPDHFSIRICDGRIEVQYAGEATLEDHLRAVQEVIGHLSEHIGFGVLVDRTAGTMVPGSAKERAIVDAIAAHAPLFAGGIALVATPGVQWGLARIQQALALNRGIPTAVFSRMDEGIAWLRARGGSTKP